MKDDIWGILIPIIFVVLWGIGKAFGTKEEDTEAPPASEKGERTRDIFRDIERKIAERRHRAQSGPPADPPPLRRESPVAQQPAMMPRQQPVQQFPRSNRGAEPPPIMQSPAFSPAPPISTYDYEKKLAVEMKLLREAKEKQEQLLQKAKIKAEKSKDSWEIKAEKSKDSWEIKAEKPKDSWEIKAKKSKDSWAIKARSSHSANFKEDLISLLQDAEGARKAVLYYEILGPPVGLRRGQGVTHFS